ncbi:hypothetical protein [Chromobacterium violaceum]|uniref:hypothetical protein n=1 Tax=Chromobacterium violaceum TaxID=536 RepID=UPI001FD180A8|nr:hypothetical protein [Chromobacterium violaceum]
MNPFASLTLPNGSLLPNRLAKAAMEENLADRDHAPSEELIRLYRAWAEGGSGLIITGNVMVDRRAMTGPGGVVLESARFGERFEQWAAAAHGYRSASFCPPSPTSAPTAGAATWKTAPACCWTSSAKCARPWAPASPCR